MSQVCLYYFKINLQYFEFTEHKFKLLLHLSYLIGVTYRIEMTIFKIFTSDLNDRNSQAFKYLEMIITQAVCLYTIYKLRNWTNKIKFLYTLCLTEQNQRPDDWWLWNKVENLQSQLLVLFNSYFKLQNISILRNLFVSILNRTTLITFSPYI